ncbi:MAG: hypothetical protein FWE21_07305 [Defluviitaleaceae bacterium]|nr:hypothetical protein [Defluviitaleaceae bacterium]
MEQTGLKNPTTAWIITAVVIIAGLFIGTFLSFNSQRNMAGDVFEAQVQPVIHRAMEFAFNIQTIAGRYLPMSDMERIAISSIVEDIREADDERDIFDHYVQLNRAVWAIYDRLSGIEMSPENRGLHARYHSNFMEQDLRLSQSPFNRYAEEFNETLDSGLGFIVRPVINHLPRFDN